MTTIFRPVDNARERAARVLSSWENGAASEKDAIEAQESLVRLLERVIAAMS